MLPLLNFASGIVAGVVGVRLLKKAKAPESVAALTRKAGDELREATVHGLSAVEKSSGRLRARLAGEPEPATEAAAPAAKRAAPARDRSHEKE